jgi:hypothetical protein
MGSSEPYNAAAPPIQAKNPATTPTRIPPMKTYLITGVIVLVALVIYHYVKGFLPGATASA